MVLLTANTMIFIKSWSIASLICIWEDSCPKLFKIVFISPLTQTNVSFQNKIHPVAEPKH